MRLATAEVLNGTVSQPSHNQTRLGRLQFAAGDLEAEQERLYMEEEEVKAGQERLYMEEAVEAGQERLYMEEEVEHSATTNAGLVAVLGNNITTRA